MPVICFEGASAAGKTSVSAYLREMHDAFVVPEVNLLFERKPNETDFWYFERQIERWKIAVRASENHKIAVLDGDPFQPLWYNWAYAYDFGETPDRIFNFYRLRLAAGDISFPDKYFVLAVERSELERRKNGDATRTRKNFARHLKFVEPQRAYFKFIKSIDDRLVEFIENEDVAETGKYVIRSLAKRFSVSSATRGLKLFDSVENWLARHKPENFISAL